jgi:nitrous oxidase accessory protein
VKTIIRIFLLIICSFVTYQPFVYSKILFVGKGLSFYNTLTLAVKKADNGDIIIVLPGIYYENSILIDKKISVIGIQHPTIDGESKNEIIKIVANGCSVQNLRIVNTGISFMQDVAGIRIESSYGVNISNNVLENTFFAIYLSNSKNCLVANNTIKGNAESESFSGNGIHLWKCDSITIEYNDIFSQRDGIYLEFAKHCIIENNLSSNNLRYGLHFMFSEGNQYLKNVFNNNGAGVAVMYTKNVVMKENKFEHNWGMNSYGLLLKDIDESIIEKNTFKQNTTGIYLEGSNNLLIKNNNFIKNGWALRILGNCYGDTVTLNNFIDNTFDVATNSSQSSNIFSFNYWNKYTGYDLDKNKIGDVPYRPVSVFSRIVEDNPNALIFLRSFFVDVLEITEKILPSFIPVNLIDNSPLMNSKSND